jgi:broad specificity phosphatase PhoE
MLLGRLGEGLAHIFTRHPEGQVVIVGHAMQLVAAMRSICPAEDPHELFHSPMGFCTISEIALDRQDGRIRGRLLSWGGGKAGG